MSPIIWLSVVALVLIQANSVIEKMVYLYTLFTYFSLPATYHGF